MYADEAEVVSALQSFKREHELIKSGKSRDACHSFQVKACCIGTIMCILSYAVYRWPRAVLTRFTFWMALLTLIHIAISLKCAIDH